MKKFKAAAKKVQVAGSLADRQPRKTITLTRKKKEVKKEKGLRGSPLHLAAANGRLDIVKSELISEEDYPVNAKYGDAEETALMYAAFHGHLEVVKALCEYPCDIYTTNKSKENALHSAAVKGHLDVCEFLTSWSREKPLKTFQEREAIRKYQERRAKNRKDQLDAGVDEIDIQESDEEVDPEWEDENADEAEDRLINQASGNQATPLMRAAYKGHLPVVELLVNRGADVTAENYTNDTALTIAVARRHTHVAMRLIEAGSDKDHANKTGWTPLMIAAGNGDKTTVETLIKRMCNVNIDSKNGMTALVAARARGEDAIVEMLKDAGALEKDELIVAKVKWAEEEEIRRNRPISADRPTTSEQRRREQSKIKIL